MASANTTGGVMGKMIDAQSIVVASTAAQVYGQESAVLRRVIWHSLALAALVRRRCSTCSPCARSSAT